MSKTFCTPTKSRKAKNEKTPKKSLAIISENSDEEDNEGQRSPRKSSRKHSPSKLYLSGEFEVESQSVKAKKSVASRRNTVNVEDSESSEEEEESREKPAIKEVQFFEDDLEVDGKRVFGFNTPKKKDGMALAAMNTPKTPKTPKIRRLSTTTPDTKRKKVNLEPKTPRHVRTRVKNQIAKICHDSSNSDFSPDGSEYAPTSSENSSPETESEEEEAELDEPTKTPGKVRQPINIATTSKTSNSYLPKRTRNKNTDEYVPESDCYFSSHSKGKIVTSDHTLDRLKNPRLPADRLFSLLASMKLSADHEKAISNLIEEYKTYFHKWIYILNEGFNILLYGLGSKRDLLQSFHRMMLADQTVLVVNGFFPSLTLKDILDSITNEILDVGTSPANPHEAVDILEEEFALIPETHLYLIVHNIDGTMLRNAKAQGVLSRLAKISNVHLLASIDHINTPLLWDNNKLSNYNFSWWDCTTMLPYTDETAFENSLLVQNSGELALASMRSVFISLTNNSRGIYMIIVKYQLKNKGNPNYQGMPFKDLYWGCREAFLVSSDLALRAQLTEFLDHKLVKSKRSVDGSEQLQIPIDSSLLQQFLDEQQQQQQQSGK